MPQQMIHAPMACTVIDVLVIEGEPVRAGQALLVLEAMKMEHEIRAEEDALVFSVLARAGETVAVGDLLLRLNPRLAEPTPAADSRHRSAEASSRAAAPSRSEPTAAGAKTRAEANAAMHAMREVAEAGPENDAAWRADLREVVARHAFTLDANRADAVAKRRARGQRTARENITDLCDPGSFIEYGALAIAAQGRRRSHDDLVRNTPADGMVTGIGGVNGALFGPEASRCVVMAYDATVLAGTQGLRNHQKTDRLLTIAAQQQLPVVLFAEGGGGRPGDTDAAVVAGLHVGTFAAYARLSGQVPVVGIAAGRCFAGNAALLGCSDVIIATRASNIGMGGPAMVEGGGLGSFAPEQIGPSEVQGCNGVIDVLVDDEPAAVAAARQYLSFFQGRLNAPAHGPWPAADQAALRDALPENRVRVYDMRRVMQLLADTGSLLELRAGFGVGIFTALARIEGRAVGVMASNPVHLGGAIDADAADKAARFMQLCDAHGLALISLVDTPGFMVGPDIETRAQVRHVSRLFVIGAQLRVPLLAVILRKGYGLGAMALTGGGFHAPLATAAWPSGEFGAMGLEGAVRLGYSKELEAVPHGPDRDALYQRLVDQQYASGKAINMAATLEIDAVIDPASTRDWLAQGLTSAQAATGRAAARPRRFIDPW